MPLAILDPQEFTEQGMFTEDGFLARAESFDFSRFDGCHVLIRGCGGIPVPPWAFMLLTARLVGRARSVRYGNEHDHITVYRAPGRPQKPVAPRNPND
ncbi:MAG TPA: DUF2480 family protein [candidate division Zixibacteria bacterium]|nr:DUF2480 family protein [candidate division Zixibacteria bacterium]MDD4916228.1 DUF2480 family protein [candidate division Zixibacteria bacterium]MDM7972748.1 DUF2480 family protein [candidate division Zixibacteria bacterium]HOD67022.1 DUF2480 family protein [candidate division Zixibacteria bacterium]HPM37533.1 DUF2480 family protein [candidate division Zixibacteria bacterium]